MDLNNIPQDVKEAFKQENQLTIQEALDQLKKWLYEKNYPAIEDWIKEIEKHILDLDEIKKIKEKLRNIKSENLQISSDNISAKIEDSKSFDQDEKMFASMSYIWFLAVVPLFLKQDSELCKHHWKQWLIYAIFFFFLFIFISFIPFIWDFLEWILKFTQLFIAIYWWIKAYKWELWQAPFIADLTKKLNF